MRHHTDRTADELRRLILSQPAVPAARLARLYGLTIQQVAGYRAAHTLKAQRQRPTSSPPRRACTPRTPITQRHEPANPNCSRARCAHARLPQRVTAQLRTARQRAERSLTGYLTKALRAATLIAATLEALDRRL